MTLLHDMAQTAAATLRDNSARAEKKNSIDFVTPDLTDVTSRKKLYQIWWAYYTNKIYTPYADGGYRNLINSYLSTSKIGDIEGIYNPTERIVDCYQLVFSGVLGREIKIDKKLPDGTSVHPAIPDALGKVWQWSNFNREKQLLARYGAALGTCGIRITAKNHADPEKRRIYLKVEHPSKILDLKTDVFGNITEIMFEYDILDGDVGGEKRTYTIREYMSKTTFASWRDDEPYDLINKTLGGEFSSYENELGVVPYVLVNHKNIGTPYGVPAIYGHERKIDQINMIAAHINQQIRRHVSVTWFMEAGGPSPQRIEIGDMSVVYVQKELGQTSQASIEPMVANLNLGDSISQLNGMIGELSNALPELKATDGQFLSHQSGGTVAQLRLPAENKIVEARGSYEDALIKAQKIALSLGILYEVPGFDLGTGIGTREAADEAYHSGAEEHIFETRPALPLTVDDKLTIAKSKQIEEGKAAQGGFGGDNTSVPSSDSTPASSQSGG